MKPINRCRIMTALFLGVLGYIPLWGQNIDFTPEKPDGPANIQSALWELATPGAGKRVGGLQDTVVVILVPQLGQGSASIDTSSLAALGGRVLAQSKSLMRIAVPPSSLLAVSEMPGFALSAGRIGRILRRRSAKGCPASAHWLITRRV